MGTIRFVFSGLLVSVMLAAVPIASSGRAHAEALELPCSLCHQGPQSTGARVKDAIGPETSRAEDIAEEIKFYTGIPRFKIHAGLEIAALGMELLGGLYALIVAIFALGFWARYAFNYFIYGNTECCELTEISPFLVWFSRALNILIAGEIIGSINTIINPSWIRIGVLLSVVIVRVLIGIILHLESSVSDHSARRRQRSLQHRAWHGPMI